MLKRSLRHRFSLFASSSTTVDRSGRRYLGPTAGKATKGGTGRPSGHPGPRGDEGDSFRRRLSYGEPDARQAEPSISEGMATWVQTVDTLDGFGPKSPSGTAVDLDPGVESFLSRKGAVTLGRFLRVGRGYSRTAALCHRMGGLPQLGVPSMFDARGLSKHDRASIYHNPRRGKCPKCATGKDQKRL